MKRVIIAGSRSFNDYDLLSTIMFDFTMLWEDWEDSINPMIVLCGKARGADELGKQWAESEGIKVEEWPAEWDKFGKAAGVLRNEQMAKNADTLVAFWDGESPGTRNMIEEALAHRLEVHVYHFTTEVTE